MTPSLDNFLDAPDVVDKFLDAPDSIDSFLDAEDRGPVLRTLDTLSDASGKVTEGIKAGAENVAQGLQQGFWQLPVTFNKAIGLGNFPGTQAAEEKAQAVAQEHDQGLEGAPFWERVGKNAAYGVGQMGATLPVDIATGGVLKGLAPGAKALQALPSFALGLGVRKAEEEGPLGFPEGVAEGLAMHGVGGLGQALPVIPRMAAQAAGQGGLSAGMTTADTLAKSGQLPTVDQVLEAGATGAAMGLPFALAPGKMGVERPRDSGVRIDTRPGGDVFDSLHGVADRAEASPLVDRIIQAESGGNPNAQAGTSSARGLGQFVKGTRDDILKRHGVDAWSADPAEQRRATEILIDENRAHLRNTLGREPSDGDVYMANFLGPGSAEKFLVGMAENAGDQAINHASPAAVRANESIFFAKDHRPRTLQEVYDMMAAKVAAKDGETSARPETVSWLTPEEQARADSISRERQPSALALPQGQGFELVGDPKPFSQAEALSMERSSLEAQAADAASDPRMTKRDLADWEKGRVQAEDSQSYLDGAAMEMSRRDNELLQYLRKSKIDPRSIEETHGKQALEDLRARLGDGYFASEKNGGQPWDSLQQEAQSQHLLSSDKDLVDTLSNVTPYSEQQRNNGVKRTLKLAEQNGDVLDGHPVEQSTPEASGLQPVNSDGTPHVDIRFHLNDKPAEAFQGIRPEDVAHGIKGYTEAAPGAAPVHIVRTMDELPPHLLEEYRRSGSTGAIEGVYDRGSRSVWLVADNLESKSRAGEIWLHENVAHHGLRSVFGTDARFDKFLTGMAKDYGFSDHIAAEEHIARIAETMNVGKALEPRDRSLWGRFTDYVRGWLVRNGWATPKPADLDALLRDSLTRMTRAGEAQGAEGSARFAVKLSQYQKDNMAGSPAKKEREWGRAWSTIQTLFVDDTAAAQRLARVAGGKEQANEFDMQARRRAGAHGIVRDMVDVNGAGVSRYGLEGKETEVVPGSKTLGQILKPLTRNPQKVADFESFMAASRKEALSDRNDKNNGKLNAINSQIVDVRKDIKTETDNSRRTQLQRFLKGLEEQQRELNKSIVIGLDRVADRGELDRLEQVYGHQGIAEFRKMHSEFVKWNEQAHLQPLVDAGALSKEAFDRIRSAPESEFYAKFSREMDDVEGSVLGSAEVKRIKGSDRKIISPIESAIADISRTVRVVEQLKTNRALIDLRDISPEVADEIKLWKKGGPNPGRDCLVTMENGQKTYWKVPWEVAMGVNGLPPVVAKIWKYTTLPAQLGAKGVRWGTTMLSPVFSARNVIRDQFTAHSLSRHGYFAPRDFSMGLAAWLGDATGKGNDVVSEWRRAGGETGVYTALERSAVEATKKGLLGITDRTIAGHALHYAASPFKAIMLASEASEQATRIGLYANARRKGASPGEAMLESRDTTVDFSRAGIAGRLINQAIPFWNANVQGLDKMFRGMPTGRFWLNSVLGITATSLMAWALHKDDDWYKELEPWEKDFFLHFKVGSVPIIRIPLAFETGLLFGAVPIRLLEWYESKDPKGVWDVAKAIKDALLPPMGLPVVQQAIENKANYSFFRDKPIENPSVQSLPPWMRSNQWTSEIAKTIGKTINYSPLKVENYLRGLTGTLGMDVAHVLDPVIRAAKGDSAPPAVGKGWWEKTPVVSGFTMADPMGSKSESVDRFYKNLEETTQASQGRKALLEAGNTAEAGQYDRNAYFGPAAKALSAKMNDMRTEIAGIQQAPNISSEEKRTRIDAINRQMTAAAREFDEAYRTGNLTPEILFLGERSRVNEALDQYKDLVKAGRVDEARALVKSAGLDVKAGLVKWADAAMAKANQIRKAVEESGPKLSGAQRTAYLAQADKLTQQALTEFQKRVGGRQ